MATRTKPTRIGDSTMATVRAASPPLFSQSPIMTLDTHSRVAAVLHIVLASLSLLVLLAIGALVGAFGAYGASMGVERQIAEWVGGIGMILVASFAVIALLEIVGAVLLLRGNDSGRVITLAFSVLHLLNIPFGTAVGIYSLWALLRQSPEPVMTRPPVRVEPTQLF